MMLLLMVFFFFVVEVEVSFVLCFESSFENGQFVIRDMGHHFINHQLSKAQNEVKKPIYVLLLDNKFFSFLRVKLKMKTVSHVDYFNIYIYI